MMADSQDAANQIQHPDWDKGASHEWGNPIPTICANVSLRQSRPVIPVRKLLSWVRASLLTVRETAKRGDGTKAIGQPRHPVAMAHPHRITLALAP
jgi:hypothetical protein